MVEKRLSSLDIEAFKEYTSSTFRMDKNNYYLSLSLFSKAFLAMSTLLTSKEVSNEFTPLVSTTSPKLNLVKLRLTNVNDILIFISIQDSLDLNQIIF